MLKLLMSKSADDGLRARLKISGQISISAKAKRKRKKWGNFYPIFLAYDDVYSDFYTLHHFIK
jgi:hypothetical protein